MRFSYSTIGRESNVATSHTVPEATFEVQKGQLKLVVDELNGKMDTSLRHVYASL